VHDQRLHAEKIKRKGAKARRKFLTAKHAKDAKENIF
jgi:hypothetical protein